MTDNTLLTVLAPVGVGVAGIVITAYLTIWSKHKDTYQARKEAQSRQTAERQEVCASLLASILQLRNSLHELRSLHDSLVRRTLFISLTMPGVRRSMQEALDALIASRSRLILDPNATSVDKAIGEFLQAWDSYSLALYKPVQTFTKKTDPQELARLEQAMNIKLVALEAAAAQFANETPAAAPSRVKRLIKAPGSLFRRSKAANAGASLTAAPKQETTK